MILKTAKKFQLFTLYNEQLVNILAYVMVNLMCKSKTIVLWRIWAFLTKHKTCFNILLQTHCSSDKIRLKNLTFLTRKSFLWHFKLQRNMGRGFWKFYILSCSKYKLCSHSLHATRFFEEKIKSWHTCHCFVVQN